MNFWNKIVISKKKLLFVVCATSMVFFIVQLITLSSPTVVGEPYFVAENLIVGNGYSSLYPFAQTSAVHSYITPFYTYITAFVLYCKGDIIALQILNLIFLHIAYSVIFFFFRKVIPLYFAFLGFVALQCYIPLWLLAECIDPNALNILMIAMTISILYSLSEKSTEKKWISLGLITGIQLLIRPDMIIGIIFFAGWAVSHIKMQPRKLLFRYAGECLLVAILIVLPWTIRNAVVFHSFIPLSANGGYNLYMGNNSVALGELLQSQETPESFSEKTEIMNYSKNHTQPELDAMLLHTALEWISDHPIDALKLAVKKFIYHWFTREHEAARPEFSFYKNLYYYFNILLVIAGFIGLFLIKNKSARTLLGTLFLYSTLVSMIFFVQSRHKMIKVDPFLIPLAAYSVLYGAKKIGQKLFP